VYHLASVDQSSLQISLVLLSIVFLASFQCGLAIPALNPLKDYGNDFKGDDVDDMAAENKIIGGAKVIPGNFVWHAQLTIYREFKAQLK